MGYGLLFMEGKTFSHNMGNSIQNFYTCDAFSIAMPMLLKGILGGVLTMLMLYTVTVLITVCCGSKFESLAYTVLINVVLPGTVLCLFYSVYSDLYGIDASDTSIKIIEYFSVAGGIVATVDWATDGGLFYRGFVNYGVWALVFFLVTAAIGALAFFLYRKRRAEQVSKPFVFKLVYYVIVTCGIFCIVSLLFEEAGVLPAIIITAIVYMIFEVVTNRGFKRFWLSIIKYAVTFIAAAAVLIIGKSTDGFGAVYRVPSAAEVTSVELRYDGFYHDFNFMRIGVYTDYYADSSYRTNSSKMLSIKDKDNIQIVIDAHKASAEHYRKYKDYSEEYYADGGVGYEYFSDTLTTGSTLEITYRLVGGRSFTRNYNSYCTETAEILSKLDLTDEYKSQTAERYKEIILTIPKAYEESIESDRTNNVTDRSYEASASSMLLGSDETATRVSIGSLCARGFYEQLAEAYYKDIMAINEENYYHSELKNVWTVGLTDGIRNTYVYLSVPESFANTVELLDYFDFNLERVEQTSDEKLLTRAYVGAASGRTQLFTEDEWRKELFAAEDTVLHTGYDYRDLGYGAETYLYKIDNNILTLMRSAMPRNIVSENGYIISVYGFSGVIPEELSDVAASIPRSGRDKSAEELYHEIVFGESN